MDVIAKNQVSSSKTEQAARRLGLLKDFEKFCGYSQRQGATRTEAMAKFAVQQGISERSLRRWIGRERQQGLSGLIDTRGGSRADHEQFSSEAFEYFKSLYLTEQRLSVKLCWQTLNYENKIEKKGWRIPSLRVVYRYIDEHIPLKVLVLHREGLAAYEAKCAPYIERDPDSIEPGQVWVGDHHQFNCWIQYRNAWLRPWITAWEDMRSRMIVGRTISGGPNQTTILTAMRQGIDRCGPPESVKIDNGRDYDSEAWTGTTKARRRAAAKGRIDEQFVTGIYAMMDIAISFAQPYHPQSKPIERWFDTLDCQFTKTIPTYCGKDADRKPEGLPDMLASDKAIAEAYSMAEFTELVDRYIEVYNNTAHTGAGMDGRSPAQVMAMRQSRRVLRDGVPDLLIQVWSRELVIGKNGIRFKGLNYGQYHHDLLWHQGKKVRVSYNPDDVSRISVYDATNLQFMCYAEQNQLVGYGPIGEEHLREGARRKGQVLRDAKRYRKTQRDAFADLPTLAIRAQQEAQQPEPVEAAATMRPVRTAMDGQVAKVRQAATRRAVKKAAGAEDMETVPAFDLGYDIFESRPKEKDPYEDIDLGISFDSPLNPCNTDSPLHEIWKKIRDDEVDENGYYRR